MMSTNLPCTTEIRNPDERIVSSSLDAILWFQQALTWPSKPQFDCIPLDEIAFT